MDKKIFWFAVLAMVAIMFAACGDDDSSSGGKSSITGSLVKGPFIKGSTVTVQMIKANAQPIAGSYFPTQTVSDLGDFSVEVDVTGAAEISADGFYYNEIAKRLSGAAITMRALYNVSGDAQVFLNAFTHMADLRGKYLMENEGKSVDEAIAQSGNELYAALGIHHPDDHTGSGDAGTGDGGTFDIGAGTSMNPVSNDADGEYVLALSCIIAKSAYLMAKDENEEDAQLQLLMNNIADDLKDDGDISQELKDKVRAGEAALNPVTDCTNNLRDYLEQQTGSVPDLPDADKSADMDGDGIPNASDPDIDGDGIPNGEDEAPYNSAVGGGMFLDSANGLAWQLTTSASTYTWADAGVFCDGLSLGGHDDWRLPTISELRTLVQGCAATQTGGECGATDTCLSASCGGGTCSGCTMSGGPGANGCYWDKVLEGPCTEIYWSASAVSDVAGSIWSMYFGSAQVSYGVSTADTNYLVRCVRSL